MPTVAMPAMAVATVTGARSRAAATRTIIAPAVAATLGSATRTHKDMGDRLAVATDIKCIRIHVAKNPAATVGVDHDHAANVFACAQAHAVATLESSGHT